MAMKRKSLSIEDKMNLLSEIDNSPRVKRSVIAKRFNLPLSTLASIVNNRKVIEGYARKMQGRVAFRRKWKCSPFRNVEIVLMAWINQCAAMNIQLNGCLIKEKGLLIARKLGLTNFTASSGWLDRFKNRYSFVYSSKKKPLPTTKEESCTSTEWMTSHLLPLIEEYDACDIYNADETGLFYNLLIDGSCYDVEEYEIPDDRKDKLTVLLCANSDGSSKLPPLIVGKCDRPRGFENFKSLPCKYVKSCKGWITVPIFEEYLHYIDSQMKTLNRKILLFVDHCAAHSPNTFLKNVKVVFFPSSCSNVVQPLSFGVINVFKQNYRKTFEHNSELLKTRNMPSSSNVELLDALQFVILSWDEVSVDIIKYCFFKVGFPIVNVDESVFACMERFGDTKTIDPHNKISTCGLLTVDELCEEFHENNVEYDSDEKFIPNVDASFEESHETNGIKGELGGTEINASDLVVTLYEGHEENASPKHENAKLNSKDKNETDDVESGIPNFEAALDGFRTYKTYVSSFNIDDDMQNTLLLMEIALYKLHSHEKLHRRTGNNAAEVPE